MKTSLVVDVVRSDGGRVSLRLLDLWRRLLVGRVRRVQDVLRR